MYTTTTTARKRVPAGLREAAQSRAPGAVPNSAVLSLQGASGAGQTADAGLGARIRGRLAGVPERPQAQIPAAEAEADRLSASVTAGSPEAVKAAMGRKLGADFSGVRFHTDAAAAARSKTMGARAYTSGADVYFGAGGFDPSVAAHELVHTVQQGMVESGAATVSTPVGGIQMEPDEEARKRKRHHHHHHHHRAAPAPQTPAPAQQAPDPAAAPAAQTAPAPAQQQQPSPKEKAELLGLTLAKEAASGGQPAGAAGQAPQKKSLGHHIRRKLEKADDATLGRTDRWHEEAIDELYAAKQGQKGQRTWDLLTPTQKRRWKAMNMAAYLEYQNSKAAREAAAKRAQQRSALKDDVGAFLEQMWAGSDDKFSFINGDEPDGGQQAGGPTFHAGEAEGRTHDAVMARDAYGEVMDQFNSITEDADADLAKGIGGVMASPLEMFNTGKEFVGAVRHGNVTDKIMATANVANTAESTYETLTAFTDKLPGVPDGLGDAMGGTMKTVEGLREVHRGRVQMGEMQDVADDVLDGRTRKELDQRALVLHDTAMQGKQQGKIMVAEGSGKAVEGGTQGLAGVLEMSGVGAVASPILKAVSYAAKGVTKAVTMGMHEKLKANVVDQTTGIKHEVIKQYLDKMGMEHSEHNIREVKRAMLRYLGYETGFREELLADQTEKRAAAILEGANNGDAECIRLAEGLGAKRDKDGKYTEGNMAERLGADKDRSEVIGRSQRINSMAAESQQRRVMKEADLRNQLEEQRAQLTEFQSTFTGSPTKEQRKTLETLQKNVTKTAAKLSERKQKNTGKYHIDPDDVEAEMARRVLAKTDREAEQRQQRVAKEAELRQELIAKRRALAERRTGGMRFGRQVAIKVLEHQASSLERRLDRRRSKNEGYQIEETESVRMAERLEREAAESRRQEALRLEVKLRRRFADERRAAGHALTEGHTWAAKRHERKAAAALKQAEKNRATNESEFHIGSMEVGEAMTATSAEKAERKKALERTLEQRLNRQQQRLAALQAREQDKATKKEVKSLQKDIQRTEKQLEERRSKNRYHGYR